MKYKIWCKTRSGIKLNGGLRWITLGLRVILSESVLKNQEKQQYTLLPKVSFSSIFVVFPLIFHFFSNRDTMTRVCYDNTLISCVSSREKLLTIAKETTYTSSYYRRSQGLCAIAVATYARSQISHSNIVRAKRASKRNTVCVRGHTACLWRDSPYGWYN